MAPEARAQRQGMENGEIPGKDFRPESSTGEILAERSQFSTPTMARDNNWRAMHDRPTSPAQDWLYKNRLSMAAADEAGQFEASKFNKQQKTQMENREGAMERLKTSQKGIAERLADTQKSLDARAEKSQAAMSERQQRGFENTAEALKAKKAASEEYENKIRDAHTDILVNEVRDGNMTIDDALAIHKIPDGKLRQAELARRHGEAEKKRAEEAKAIAPQIKNFSTDSSKADWRQYNPETRTWEPAKMGSGAKPSGTAGANDVLDKTKPK